MKKEIGLFDKIWICVGLVAALGVVYRVQAQDNVFIVNRNDMTDKEEEIAQQAPSYIEFDPDGNVVNSFGDWKVVPNITHGCIIDYENNFWTARCRASLASICSVV